MLQQIAAGIGMGIVVLSSQYWGQRRTGPIKKIISVGVRFGLFVGIVFLILSILFPGQILSLFTGDAAVVAEGVRYLRIICWTYLIFPVSNSLMYSLINSCCNYCLIYGHFGFPELGIRGAAIATLISRIVELIIIVLYIFFIDKKLRMKARDFLSFEKEYVRDYIRIAAPVTLSGLLWGVAQAAQTAVLGHISAAVIAANSIAIVVFQIFAVVGMSCANVASVVTGKTIGQGRFSRIRSYAKTMQAIFIIIGILSGLLLFVCKDAIVGFYTVSDKTKSLALSFLTILSITTVGTCYEYPVESGIVSGGGLTRYPAIIDNLFMWIFTIPAAYLSAFVFHLPPAATFWFLKADQLLKCIPNSITVNRYRWVRVLTRSADEE